MGYKNKFITKSCKSAVLRNLLIFYVCILLLATALVGRYYYLNKKDSYLQEANTILIYLMTEYKALTEDFWKYYLPIFQNNGYSVLNRYFEQESEEDIEPIEKLQLINSLAHSGAQSESLGWIALYAPERAINYIFINDDLGHLEVIPEGFPFFSQVDLQNTHHMQLMGGFLKVWNKNYIVIVGGTPAYASNGKMLFGFDTDIFDAIVDEYKNIWSTLEFYIVEDGQILYTTCDRTEKNILVQDRNATALYSSDGIYTLVYPLKDSPRQSTCYFTIAWSELFFTSCAGAIGIIVLMILAVVVTIILFKSAMAFIWRETAVIRKGLEYIGENHLEYRFVLKFYNGEFNEIASAINKMAEALQHTVEQLYKFEIEQRKYEFAELMAKFDPHFLYNTLELFRARCARNGDIETANLITHASTIFRGLLSSRNIVTLREELAFSEHYLKLFRARYDDGVKIFYDFDSEILDCFVIRNIFQPLIENYFEHAYNSNRNDNCLWLHGKKVKEDMLCLSVDDNGMGMTPESIQILQMSLNSMASDENDSYGLRNLHQRIRLYYGKDYGLTITSNSHGGLSVVIHIRRIIDC